MTEREMDAREGRAALPRQQASVSRAKQGARDVCLPMAACGGCSSGPKAQSGSGSTTGGARHRAAVGCGSAMLDRCWSANAAKASTPSAEACLAVQQTVGPRHLRTTSSSSPCAAGR